MHLVEKEVETVIGTVIAPANVGRVDGVQLRESPDRDQADPVHGREHRAVAETVLDFGRHVTRGQNVVRIRHDFTVGGDGALKLENVCTTVEVKPG